MRRPVFTLFIALVFVTILSSTGCDVLWSIGRAVVNQRILSDTTGVWTGAFSLTSYPGYPAPHETVRFSLATHSSGSFSWDFGDGTSFYSSSRQVEHEYAQAGSYTVTVSIGASENKQTTTETVYVRSP